MNEVDSAQVFLQVLRSNGFTGAAKALGRSASTLSRVLAALEQHLGSPLFARTTRSLHLTEAGALYQTHAEQLVATSRAAQDALAELRGGIPRGHLRVSMPVSVGERLLAPQLPRFRALHPELHLSIDLSDRNVSLTQGGFDLALRVGRPHDTSLRALLLGKIPVYVVAAPSYLEGRKPIVKPADLAKHAAVAVAFHEWTFFRAGKQRTRKRTIVTIRPVITTTSPTLAVQLAERGQGIIRTAEWLVRDELERGTLVRVLPGWSCGNVPVYVMYAQAGSVIPPRKSRAFVDFIKEIMSAEVSPGQRRP